MLLRMDCERMDPQQRWERNKRSVSRGGPLLPSARERPLAPRHIQFFTSRTLGNAARKLVKVGPPASVAEPLPT